MIRKRGGVSEVAADGEPDEQVVARILGGDVDAYELLVERYQEGLFRFALGMVGSADAAADLVQDSFVKAYTDLESCRDTTRFGAWLNRIVRNRCLDYLKDRRRKNLPLKDELIVGGEEPALDVAEQDETLRLVMGALDRLPPDQREAFLLKHVEDRQYDEMAEILEASVSALKMRVKRAREKLQLELSQTLNL